MKVQPGPNYPDNESVEEGNATRIYRRGVSLFPENIAIDPKFQYSIDLSCESKVLSDDSGRVFRQCVSWADCQTTESKNHRASGGDVLGICLHLAAVEVPLREFTI